MVKRVAELCFHMYVLHMATLAATTEFQPLPTTREQRGREIAKLGRIRQRGGLFIVPSQSGDASYVVDVADETCTCPDFEARRQRCKHAEACLFWVAWEGIVSNDGNDDTAVTKRPTYGQDWRSYNKAQMTERERVPQLLRSLCDTVTEPERAAGKPGRKPIPRAEAIFAAVMKVYTTCSGRRADADIKACVDRGLLGHKWDPATLFRVMEDPSITPELIRLIMLSSAPLAGIEAAAGAQYAQDSTGFSTVFYNRWFEHKHGKKRAKPDPTKADEVVEPSLEDGSGKRKWIKLHLMVGTVTHVVTGVKVSKQGDCPVLPETFAQTLVYHQVREVSGDKAYLDKDHLELIANAGAQAYIRFKDNSRGMDHESPHWRRMWCLFQLKEKEFLRHYHRRSNVESAIGAIKARFGGGVRSKLPTAQMNEVLAKVLLHNLTCIVKAIEQHGIDVSFPLDGKVTP
jgi:hypothetical protein